MIFHHSVLPDIKKYYTNNIIKLKETGDRLWKIKNIYSHEVLLVDVDGFELTIDLDEEYEVNFPLPARAVYQHGSKAAFLYRKPARQFYRGIYETNTGLMYLRGDGSWGNLSPNLETLQQFVDKPAYQTVEYLNPEYDSWALSPHVCLAAAGPVFVLQTLVGHAIIKDKVLALSKKTQIFKPELQAIFKDWKLV